MIALEFENLHSGYAGKPVLENVSFKVKKGEFFIIIGSNGSGKTTLLKTINRIIKPRQGTLKILGRSHKQYSAKDVARQISLVPQELPADFPFTVLETVMMGRYPHLGIWGIEGETDRKIAVAAMKFTQVCQFADRKLDQLSSGERQRVFIARAICQDPQIILLDEPTAALDLAHQVRIMDLMEKLKREKKTTIVMVSHDINLASMYGDRLLLLKQGKVLTIGTPNDVIRYSTLENAYGCVLMVDENPLGNVPRVMPVPQRFLDQSNTKHWKKEEEC